MNDEAENDLCEELKALDPVGREAMLKVLERMIEYQRDVVVVKDAGAIRFLTVY